MSKPTFERSAQVQWLVDELLTHKPGELIPYDKLSDVAGQDVFRERPWLLRSAREILLREHQIATGAVPKVGIQVLRPDEVIDDVSGRVKRIRSAARRANMVSHCAEDVDLSSDDRLRKLARQSFFSMVETLTRPKAQKRIESNVTTRPLNFTEMFKAIRSSERVRTTR